VPRDRPLDPDAVRVAQSHLLPLSAETQARELLVVASDLSRLQIVRALAASPLAAGDLAHLIGRSRAATSQHLAVLRGVGAVTSTRSGNVVRYRLGDNSSARILSAIARAFDAAAVKSR
jgi:DNA-binding transcriptional ArsR family regulator